MSVSNKDWIGDTNSVFKCLGSSHHTDHDRETHDYYATDPVAMELLLKEEELRNVWECACGEGHLCGVLDAHGVLGRSSDIVDRGYGETADFLSPGITSWDGDIATNPPYKYALEFCRKGLDIVSEGRKVCMFLRLQFLEGKSRKGFFMKHPPHTVYVASSRIRCAINGDFKPKASSAVAYAWFVWRKGYTGETHVKWIN